MKKPLNSQQPGNEGFFLPYVIFISMLILLNITTMVMLHENRANTNKTMNELIEIETLIQMTRTRFIEEELYDSGEAGEYNYEHPNGQVDFSFVWLDETTVEVTTDIQTVNGLDLRRGFRLYFPEKADKAEASTKE